MEKFLIDYKDLTRKEKIEHIFEYYKLHMIVGAVLVLMIGWALNHYIINPPAEVTFDISFFSNYENSDFKFELQLKLNELIMNPEENEESFVEFFTIAEDADYNYLMASRTKLAGKSSLGEFDIIVFEGESYRMFLEEDALLSLSQFFTEYGKGVDYSQLESEGKLLKGTPLNLVPDDYYLIDVSESKGFQKLLETKEKIYLGIHVSTKHQENINKALEYLLYEFNL